jgi:putative hydrolase of the HAD superfamily
MKAIGSRTFAAVIFDFGGVVTSSPFEAFNRLEAARGLPQDFIRRVNAANPDTNAWARFERAELDAAAFDAAFAAEATALGHSLPGRDVIACLAGDIRQPVVDAIDAIKAAGLQLGCITNNVPAGKGAGMAGTQARAAEMAAVLARFDHVIESSKVGLRKPDPRIYMMMCAALNRAPDQCIYLDDLGINCKPAAAMGMHAIKVTDEAQLLADLGAALDFSLAAS